MTGWTITLIGGPAELELQSEDVTPEFEEWATTYPECTSGTCMLDLRKLGVSCFEVVAPCADWLADPDRDTDYTCHYGTHAVDLSECFVYGPTFKPDSTGTGNVYGDPETGLGVGVQTAPTSDASTFGSSVQDPSTTRQCFPTGWAVLNPVEWVMKPVQCALEWAFVPRPAKVDELTEELTEPWGNTAPYKLMAAVAAWTFVPPPSGCDGITVNVWFLGPPFQIMNACPGSIMADMATWSRIFGNVGFSIYGVIAITRNVARIFEFPGIGQPNG